MKNVLFAAVLMALFSSTAYAADTKVSGTIGAATDVLVRGETVTKGDPSLFGAVNVDNLFIDNLSFNVDAVLLNAAPINVSKTTRVDVGLAYGFDIAPAVTGAVGVNRVINPVTYGADYNELRGSVNWQVQDKLSVYSTVGRILSDTVPNDAYLAVGVKYADLFVDGLSVSAQTSTLHQDVTSDFAFNNFEVAASYNVTPNLQAFGMYSYGGSHVNHTARGIPQANGIASGGSLGLRYNF